MYVFVYQDYVNLKMEVSKLIGGKRVIKLLLKARRQGCPCRIYVVGTERRRVGPGRAMGRWFVSSLYTLQQRVRSYLLILLNVKALNKNQT